MGAVAAVNNPNRRRYPKHEKDAAIQLVLGGATTLDAAKAAGASSSSISYWMMQAGYIYDAATNTWIPKPKRPYTRRAPTLSAPVEQGAYTAKLVDTPAGPLLTDISPDPAPTKSPFKTAEEEKVARIMALATRMADLQTQLAEVKAAMLRAVRGQE